ncbi:MAG TPA: hypothetical protein VFA13_09615 [Candidatus Acidoferrum sp.]|nr:hypothetical protein [Candidatus Acidoferrum sp.]
MPSLCVPSDLTVAAETGEPVAVIPLIVPSGTPLRIALDRKARLSRVGEPIHGKVVQTVYAFDQPLVPAGSIVTGRVTKIEPVSPGRRTLAYANGNFSPFRKYEVEFDTLTLPDGRQVAIHTKVSPGSADVVHLVSNPTREEKKRGIVGQGTARAKQEAQERLHEADAALHQTTTQIRAPGKLHRLKQFLLAQLPYRRQYIEAGTRFNASIEDPLNFGATTRTSEQLAAVGTEPPPASLLRARLVIEVSSATARRGNPVVAALTEPLYSPDHRLILPADTRLIGEVLEAKPARKLHHNGELRVIFEHIETPDGMLQPMQGSLEGAEVERSANMKLDEEGGAHAADGKTRYVSTGLAILMAAAASHPDAEHGGVDQAGDPAVRAGAGVSGFGVTGSLVSLVAKSAAVSAIFGAYGASASIYSNFLSRGRDVVFPKDTPLEIGFAPPHATPSAGAGTAPPRKH